MFKNLGGLALAATLLASPVLAEDTALILSNTDYRSIRDLRDSVGYQQVAQQLNQAGFNVVTQADGGTAALAAAAANAVGGLSKGDRFVVVLQGYFATAGGTTYLTGTRLRNPDAFSISMNGVSVNALVEAAGDYQGRALIAMVRPSRDLSDRAGLAFGLKPIPAPQGVTLVQGDGDNVADFISEIFGQSGASVAQAAADAGLNITGYAPDMAFAGGGSAPVATPDRLTEQDYWQVVKNIDTVAAYERYLRDYPDGEFRTSARRAIEFLEDAPSRAAEAAEANLNLSRRERQSIQADLTLLGYNTRGVDGVFGRGTRSAIGNWQQATGFESTGFLTRRQIGRLNDQAEVKQAELDQIAAENAAAEREQDRDYWWETGRGRSEAGLRAYLERYPNGEFSETARARLAEIAPPEPQVSQAQIDQDKAQENRLAGNSITRLLVEKGLANLNINPGRIDGRFDGNTRRAIKVFQTNNNIPATGFVGQATAVRLLNTQ